LGARVEAVGKIDEEDHGDRYEPEAGDEEAQPPPIATGGQDAEGDGDHSQRDEEV
jgi:hypothetical protein